MEFLTLGHCLWMKNVYSRWFRLLENILKLMTMVIGDTSSRATLTQRQELLELLVLGSVAVSDNSP